MKKKVRLFTLCLGYLSVFLGFIFCVLIFWIQNRFGNVPFSQIIDVLEKPLTGVSWAVIKVEDIFLLLSACVVFYLILVTLKKKRFYIQVLVIISLLFSVFLYVDSFRNILMPLIVPKDIGGLISKFTPKDQFPDEYVVQNFKIENKRNLIVVMLESYEKGFLSEALFKEDLSPYLKKLREDNLELTGCFQPTELACTFNSNVALFCGGYFDVEELKNLRKKYQKGICSPSFFQEAGYETVYLNAGDVRFAGTDVFAKENGFLRVLGKIELKDNYEGEEKYRWGLTDFQMYQEAQKELLKLAQTDKPFLMMMQQVGTHGPFGDASSKYCTAKYGDYRDAIACTDKATGAFLEWLKQQDFYQNTTIVVMGDHLSVFQFNDKVLKQNFYHSQKWREIYLTILNPVKELKQQTDVFSVADVGASILDAMGVQFDGRFGYGRSVFRSEPTLLKRYLEEISL